MRIWVDMILPSDPFFLKPIITNLPGHDIYVTVRERAETADLCRSLNIRADVVGRDYSNRFKKSVNLIYRTLVLAAKVSKYDISLSVEDSICIAASKMRFKPSVLYCDNDLELFHRTFIKGIESNIKARATYIVCPAAFRIEGLIREGAKEDHIYQYDGYKEDVYVADFEPDPDFLNKLPFTEFVAVRPEALFAGYVGAKRSIVPQLVKGFVDKGINVVYLPRIDEDLRYVEEINSGRLFTPTEETLNGLDVCWYSDAVLTGSGTFAREAACLGTTAVSFFPEQLLSVDQSLVNEGRMYHSREADQIIEYVASNSGKTKNPDVKRSKGVQQEVLSITNTILQKHI